MVELNDFTCQFETDNSLEELVNLAQKENWNYRYATSSDEYPILVNYLRQTCQRLRDENKLSTSVDDQRVCFNTGLVTENQEEIFALFELTSAGNQKWQLMGFFKESSRVLLPFNPLPQIADYFDDPRDLLYDVRLEMRINYDHIIEHNKDRFPEPYNSQTSYQLRNYLDAVVKQAVKRVKRNYKAAVPQYYQGRIQLLLPLCFETPNRADLALVVERHNDVYRANTCLTIDMAYNNVRVLAKPGNEWLGP